jgi:hypothetical protein
VRPVNLIPRDLRPTRGFVVATPGSRTGFAVYVVLGALALAVVGVTALVATSKGVNDRKDRVAKAKNDELVAKRAADALRPYGTFAAMQRARVSTIKSLVDSSFNWERVIRALSRTIPSNAWLVSFKGTVRPGVDVAAGDSGGGLGGLRSKSDAPAIELVGCTYSHASVARMMTRMRNIDSVTEVVLKDSQKPQGSGQNKTPVGGESGSSGKTGGDCRTKYHIPKFEILVVLGAADTGAPVASAGSATSPVDKAQGAVGTANSYSPTGAGSHP